jgi:hypothetical protein
LTSKATPASVDAKARQSALLRLVRSLILGRSDLPDFNQIKLRTVVVAAAAVGMWATRASVVQALWLRSCFRNCDQRLSSQVATGKTSLCRARRRIDFGAESIVQFNGLLPTEMRRLKQLEEKSASSGRGAASSVSFKKGYSSRFGLYFSTVRSVRIHFGLCRSNSI